MKEERLAAARVFLSEGGYSNLLIDSPILNLGLQIAAGAITIKEANEKKKQITQVDHTWDDFTH
jgi:hypothetical protein